MRIQRVQYHCFPDGEDTLAYPPGFKLAALAMSAMIHRRLFKYLWLPGAKYNRQPVHA